MSTQHQFDGETFNQKRDGKRLSSQLGAVQKVMADGLWRTLGMIVVQTGGGASEASVSARLRDFRKPKFGGHTVERKYIRNGLWKYRLILRKVAS